MKPIYSVILPFYNAAETLTESLTSALEQSFSDFEIIAVNDGSTDKGAALIRAAQKAHPQFPLHLVEHPRNHGLGAARNSGIAEAKGKYCALLDADDLWTPHKLASCHSFLCQSPETDVLYHPVIAFNEQQEKKRRSYPLQELTEILEKGCPLVPSASLIKRELLRKETFSTDPNLHGAEDLDLWLRLFHQGHRFDFWPEYLSYYRSEGGMSSELEKHLQHVMAVYEKHYRAGLYNQTWLEIARRRKYYELARALHKQGANFKAERYYSAADSKSMKIIGMRLLNKLGINW